MFFSVSLAVLYFFSIVYDFPALVWMAQQIHAARAEFAGCKSGLNKGFPNHFTLNLIAGRIGVPGVEKFKIAYVV